MIVVIAMHILVKRLFRQLPMINDTDSNNSINE